MPDETFYNPNTRRVESRRTSSTEEVESAQDKDRLSGFDATKLSKLNKVDYGASGTPRPKRESYGAGLAGTAAYSKALREWQRNEASGSSAPKPSATPRPDMGREQRDAIAGN